MDIMFFFSVQGNSTTEDVSEKKIFIFISRKNCQPLLTRRPAIHALPLRSIGYDSDKL